MTEAQQLADECKRLAEEFADARYEEAKDQDHGGGRADTEYCRAEVARTRQAMTDAIDKLASMIPAGGLAEEARRMDWLESMANKPGGLLLHDGSERGRVGLGLRPGRLSRTLREAIDAAMASSTPQGKETP